MMLTTAALLLDCANLIDFCIRIQTRTRMKFAFMLCDEDSTGSITHHELVLILRANHCAKTEAEVTRKAETIIAQCDKRNDGTITFDEFVVVSRKFPNILFPQQIQR
jgi:serine/threonine-protein phosphatase 2B regulatory subunit